VLQLLIQTLMSNIPFMVFWRWERFQIEHGKRIIN
jgi:hypothetical protein